MTRIPTPIPVTAPPDGRLSLSTLGARVVIDVRDKQVLAVQGVAEPGSAWGSAVVTPYASNDGLNTDDIPTDAMPGDGTLSADGDIVYINKTLLPFPFLILETTTAHEAGGQFATFHIFGAAPFTAPPN